MLAGEERCVLRLRIVPINRIDSELLARLGHCLEERFLLEARVEQSISISELTLNRERDQLFFPTLVSRVLGVHASHDDMVLAVTMFDLYKTTQRFIYSGWTDDGRLAGVSLKRFMTDRDPSADPNLMFQRLLKTSTNALGRAFGLTPCHNDRCVMSITGTVFEIDSAGSHLCDICERKNRSRQSTPGY